VWNLDTGAVAYDLPYTDRNSLRADFRVQFAQRGDWLVGAHYHGATIWDPDRYTTAKDMADDLRQFREPGTARADVPVVELMEALLPVAPSASCHAGLSSMTLPSGSA
jgi:hypothetical protein